MATERQARGSNGGMPCRPAGRTKVSTNLRVQPGRTEPRLYKFGRNAPVEMVGRAVADWVQAADEKEAANEAAGDKKEDWFWSVALRCDRLGKPRLAQPNPQTPRSRRSDHTHRGLGGGPVRGAGFAGSRARRSGFRKYPARWPGLN